MTPYQIVVPLLALIAVAYAWNLTLRQKKSIWESCLWTLFWGAIALVALSPNSLSYLSALTGIKRQENAALVTSIGLLFFLIFLLIIRVEELEQKQTKLIRRLALKELDKP